MHLFRERERNRERKKIQNTNKNKKNIPEVQEEERKLEGIELGW